MLRLLLLVIGSVMIALGSQDAPGQLVGGRDVMLERKGDVLEVTVTGPRAGLASLCVGDESRVRILHASAAVGEASYGREDGVWVR